jgi:hypothetical protein
MLVIYIRFILWCTDPWTSSVRMRVFLDFFFYPCFLFSCKANASVKPAKTGHGPHSYQFLCCSMYFCVLCIFCVVECFLCCSMYCLFCDVLCIVCVYVYVCVLKYCHRVATQLQLNISYHTIYHISSYHIIYHIIISFIISYAISYIIYHVSYHIYHISYHISYMLYNISYISYHRNTIFCLSSEISPLLHRSVSRPYHSKYCTYTTIGQVLYFFRKYQNRKWFPSTR